MTVEHVVHMTTLYCSLQTNRSEDEKFASLWITIQGGIKQKLRNDLIKNRLLDHEDVDMYGFFWENKEIV